MMMMMMMILLFSFVCLFFPSSPRVFWFYFVFETKIEVSQIASCLKVLLNTSSPFPCTWNHILNFYVPRSVWPDLSWQLNSHWQKSPSPLRTLIRHRLSVTGHTSPLPFRTTSHPQPVIFQMNARICRIPKSIQSRGNDIDFYGLILGEPVFTGQLIESLAMSLADAGFLGSLWF